MEEPSLSDHISEVDLLGGVGLEAGAGAGGLDLILGIGSEELLPGDIPEQYDHGRQEDG